MKVAVQLYGHLRTFERCASNLGRNLLDRYDCEVFIHSWSKTEHTNRSWYSDSIRTNPKPISQATINQIKEVYRPRELRIDNQQVYYSADKKFGSLDGNGASLQGVRGFIQSIYEVTKLRNEWQMRSHVEFDLVIMTRPDIDFLEPVKLQKYLDHLRLFPNAMFHLIDKPLLQNDGDYFFLNPIASDLAMLSLPDTMNVFSEIVNDFEDYFIRFPKVTPFKFSSPEISFVEFLRSRKIHSIYTQFPFAIRRINPKDDIYPRYLNSKKDSAIKIILNKLFRNLFKLGSLTKQIGKKNYTD